VSSINESGPTEIFIDTLLSEELVVHHSLKMTRGNEISKLPLLQGSVCVLPADSQYRNVIKIVQGSSSTAQMGMLFSVRAARTHCGNNKLCVFFLMLHRILTARIWQQDVASRTLMVAC